MKKRVALIGGAILALLLVFLLVGDGVKRVIETPAPEETPAVEEPIELTPEQAAADELQFLLEVVHNSTYATSWTPEQPTAKILVRESCEAPVNSYWSIERVGTPAGELDHLASNLENTFANSPYVVTTVAPTEFLISGESGFEATVTVDEQADSVTLILNSACFEDSGL